MTSAALKADQRWQHSLKCAFHSAFQISCAIKHWNLRLFVLQSFVWDVPVEEDAVCVWRWGNDWAMCWLWSMMQLYRTFGKWRAAVRRRTTASICATAVKWKKSNNLLNDLKGGEQRINQKHSASASHLVLIVKIYI